MSRNKNGRKPSARPRRSARRRKLVGVRSADGARKMQPMKGGGAAKKRKPERRRRRSRRRFGSSKRGPGEPLAANANWKRCA